MALRTIVIFLALACVAAAQSRTRKIILVTVDGLRWQELFNGVDASLAGKLRIPEDKRREAILPFFWNTFARQGVVFGNPAKNSSVEVTNSFRVSYPGYSEILTGRAQDSVIRGNEKIQNPTETVLEFVRRKLRLPRSRVAVFASWDVFPFIAESKPGSIYINAGYQDDPTMPDLSALQTEAMTAWDGVRHDYVTLNMAINYLRRKKPRVLHIALGETDDWAHDRRYDRVIQSIRYFDTALEYLVTVVQGTPEYRGNTTIIVTSDHGRGSTAEDWTSHGEKVPGAEKIWLAMWGADVPALGEISNSAPVFQRDVAPTMLRVLRIDPASYSGVEGRSVLPLKGK